MLIDIHKTSKVGLNVHQDKTKVMLNDRVRKSTLSVDGMIIEEADSYVYLGRHSRETVIYFLRSGEGLHLTGRPLLK